MAFVHSPNASLNGAASAVDMTSSAALSASTSSLSSSMSFELVQSGERPPVTQDDGGESSMSSVLLSGHDSDDEIVWSLSEGEGDLFSDSDFVVLNRKRSPVVQSNVQGFDSSTVAGPSSSVAQLVSEFAMMDLTAANQQPQTKTLGDSGSPEVENDLGAKGKERKGRKKREKRKKEGVAQTRNGVAVITSAVPQTSPPNELLSSAHEARLYKSASTATLVPSTPAVKPSQGLVSPANGKKTKFRPKKKAAAAKATSGVPSTSASIDAPDGQKGSLGNKDNSGDERKPTPYDEATEYVSKYISNPQAHQDKTCHLTLLQSVIIELGLLSDPSLLPCTLTAAKRFIKSHAFLNIKDYIAKRGRGQAALKSILFSSRSALLRDLRKKRNFASLAWVKKNGLQDLLVSPLHH